MHKQWRRIRGNAKMIRSQAQWIHCAPVAQLDRALASEARGRAFESPRARHKNFDYKRFSCFGWVVFWPKIGLV